MVLGLFFVIGYLLLGTRHCAPEPVSLVALPCPFTKTVVNVFVKNWGKMYETRNEWDIELWPANKYLNM